jgi:hypothetical protein
MAAVGGVDRRSAKHAAAPMDQIGPARQPVIGRPHIVPATARSVHGPGKLVAINGVTRILTCPVVCLERGQAACGTGA